MAGVTVTREVAAHLTWCVAHGKTVEYPRGKSFATPARFEHQGKAWTNDAWSLVVSASEPVAPDSTQRVLVRFLMDDAPENWLVPGKKFQLYEGQLLLAEGVIG